MDKIIEKLDKLKRETNSKYKGTAEYHAAMATWCRHSLRAANKVRTTQAAYGVFHRSPDGSEAYHIARDKLDTFVAADVWRARTIEQLVAAYNFARQGSNTETVARCRFDEIVMPKAKISKTIEDCQAFMEILKVHNLFWRRRDLASAKLVLRTWNALCLEKLKRAKNKEQAMEVYDVAPRDSPAQVEAARLSNELPIGKGRDRRVTFDPDDSKIHDVFK